MTQRQRTKSEQEKIKGERCAMNRRQWATNEQEKSKGGAVVLTQRRSRSDPAVIRQQARSSRDGAGRGKGGMWEREGGGKETQQPITRSLWYTEGRRIVLANHGDVSAFDYFL